MASPRKHGNSAQMTKLLEEELRATGNVEVEYLFLCDYELGNCTGCHNCIIKGETFCPYFKTHSIFLDKMSKADGLIFVSSIYSFHINTLLKQFIDHLSFLVHRPRYFGKPALIFVVRGGQFKSSLNYVELVMKRWGFNVVEKLGCFEISTVTPKYQEKVRKDLKKAAKKFFSSLHSDNFPRPSIGDLVYFNIWKLNAVNLKDDLTADYLYWTKKRWLQSDYYYTT